MKTSVSEVHRAVNLTADYMIHKLRLRYHLMRSHKEFMYICTYVCMYVCMYVSMEVRMYGRMDVRTYGRMECMYVCNAMQCKVM